MNLKRFSKAVCSNLGLKAGKRKIEVAEVQASSVDWEEAIPLTTSFKPGS